MIDYERLILIAQEREEHPELGVPVWGNDKPVVQRSSHARSTGNDEDDFYASMVDRYDD